ncbi:MAG: iron-containing alcohol dehydrogenase [Dehalococcoidia bacterium]
MDSATFRAVSYPWRLYRGQNALGNLGAEAQRHGARRALVVCGQTIAHRTNVVQRIAAQLDKAFAGVYDGVDKNCTWDAMLRGAEAARKAEADMIIAVGGGTVMMGGRIIAILVAEQGDPFEMITQYPQGKPAISPKLMAPKVPIINVVTTPTSAMNRGGSAAKNDEIDHRMEFFDPKTRPVALFWDHEAIMTAPPDLIRSAGATTLSGSLHALGSRDANPLLEGDRLQAFRLSYRALPLIAAEPENIVPRIDLFTAAFLQNRAADDGGRDIRHEAASASYALASVMHTKYRHVGQGEATTAVQATVIRRSSPEDMGDPALVAQGLGVWREGMSDSATLGATADAIEAVYVRAGLPVRVRDLNVPEADLPVLAHETLKIFNAYRGTRPEDYAGRMLAHLRAAW